MKKIKISKKCDTNWTLGIQKSNKIILTVTGSVFKPIAPENNSGITKWKNHFPKMVEFLVMCLLRNSKKDCVASLAKRVCSDQNSITKNNFNLIEKESNCIEILSLNDCQGIIATLSRLKVGCNWVC